MIDHYEMPHPMADHCPHAGVGKACRPCRQKFRWTADDLRDTPAGRALLAEGWDACAKWGVDCDWAATGQMHAALDANPYHP